MDISNEYWQVTHSKYEGFAVKNKVTGERRQFHAGFGLKNVSGPLNGASTHAFNRKCNYAFMTGEWYDFQKSELERQKVALCNLYRNVNGDFGEESWKII